MLPVVWFGADFVKDEPVVLDHLQCFGLLLRDLSQRVLPNEGTVFCHQSGRRTRPGFSACHAIIDAAVFDTSCAIERNWSPHSSPTDTPSAPPYTPAAAARRRFAYISTAAGASRSLPRSKKTGSSSRRFFAFASKSANLIRWALLPRPKHRTAS